MILSPRRKPAENRQKEPTTSKIEILKVISLFIHIVCQLLSSVTICDGEADTQTHLPSIQLSPAAKIKHIFTSQPDLLTSKRKEGMAHFLILNQQGGLKMKKNMTCMTGFKIYEGLKTLSINLISPRKYLVGSFRILKHHKEIIRSSVFTNTKNKL